MERILGAAEELLREKPFDGVTVAEIVRRADSSVGAFYARFPAKAALLSALYARRHGMRQTERGRSYLAHFASRRMTLEERAREVVGQMVTYYRLNRHVLRGLGAAERPSLGQTT